MVCIDDGTLSQIILCAENEEVAEVPGKMLVDGLFYLLASYYVYGVAYLKGCTALSYYPDGKTGYTRPGEKQADML